MSARIKSTSSNSSVKKAPAPSPPTTTAHRDGGISVTRLSRNVSKPVTENPVKLPSSRLLVDVAKNKKTVTNSKSLADVRVSKLSFRPEAQKKLPPKSMDLQAQVNGLREDLKTAMDQFNQVAKEKVEITDELTLAQKISKEANEKLVEAVAVQKRTEEALKLEKLRVMETEQNGIEALNKETDDLKAQLASNADALLSIKQEMVRVKDELNQTIGRADQKAEEAKCFSDKVDILTSEISGSKSLIDSMTTAAENDAKKLEEIERLLGESVQKTASLMESIDALRVEVEASRNAEAESRGLVEDWKQKAEELQKQVEEAKLSEKMALESVSTVTVELEETRVSLMEADIKGTRLTEKIAESEDRAFKAEADASKMAKTIETLKIQLDAVQEEKLQANSKSALLISNKQLEEENLLQEHDEERLALGKANTESVKLKETMLDNEDEDLRTGEAAADTKTEPSTEENL